MYVGRENLLHKIDSQKNRFNQKRSKMYECFVVNIIKRIYTLISKYASILVYEYNG